MNTLVDAESSVVGQFKVGICGSVIWRLLATKRGRLFMVLLDKSRLQIHENYELPLDDKRDR